MKKVVAVLTITILMASAAFAQVHIRDTISISNGKAKKVLDGGDIKYHTVRFELHWANQGEGCAECFERYPCPWQVSLESCRDNPIIINDTLPAGNYGFQVGPPGSWWYAYCEIFEDDSLMDSVSLRSYPSIYVNYTTSYYSKFNFYASYYTLWSGDYTPFNLDGYDDCSTTSWSSTTDPVTLMIISGSQYASFHTIDPETGKDDSTGSVVSTTGDNIWNVHLVVDGVLPDSDGDWVAVQAMSNGITGIDSVLVFPGLDHFYVYAAPDTISHSDSGSTIIYVQAKDKDDRNVDYYGDILISASPAGYGDLGYTEPSSSIENGNASSKRVPPNVLSSAKSSVVKRQNKSLPMLTVQAVEKNVATTDELQLGYWAANGGYLYYAPDGTVPDSNTTITFTVTTVDNPSATGKGSVVIKGGITKFCQGNYPYVRYDSSVIKKKDKSGDSTDAQGNIVYSSVASEGCALTCMAMIAKAGGANIDPGILAAMMDDTSHYGFNGGGVFWKVIDTLQGNEKYTYKYVSGLGLKRSHGKPDTSISTPLDLSNMDDDLSNGALVVAQVYNPTTGHTHWVLVRGKNGSAYNIYDPGCYDGRDDLTAYGNHVYRFVVYRRK
jgi:hypothetical protein